MDSAGVDNSVLNHSYLAYTRLWCDSSILPLSETRLLRSLSYEAFKPAMFWMAAFCKQGLNSKWRLPFYFQKDLYDWDDHKMLSHRPASTFNRHNIMPFYGRACSMWYFLFSCLFHFHYHEKLKHLQTPWTGFALSLGFYLFEGEKLRVFKVVTMHCRT